MEDFFSRFQAILGNNFSKYSTSEVITPSWVVSDMVDLLPSEVFAPESRFLDPAVKSGRFLAEIFRRLFSSPLLAERFPNETDRRQHILNNQLYGLATSTAAAAIVRKQLYNDATVAGNIVYVDSYLAKIADKGTDFRRLIEKEFGQMKFDVVIGNPPYQQSTGGGSTTEVAMPLYNKFIAKAMELHSNYTVMIIPSRWMSGGKYVLDEMRATIIESKQLTHVYNFEKASEVFDGVDIAGGVQYIVLSNRRSDKLTTVNNCDILNGKTRIVKTDKRDIGKYQYKDSKGKEQYMIVIDNDAAKIVEKVWNYGGIRMDSTVLSYRPFGLGSDFEDALWQEADKPIKVVCSNGREVWTDLDAITSNKNEVNKWKICAGKVTGYADPKQRSSGKAHPIINTPFILKPNEVCSMTYLVLYTCSSENEAIQALKFIKTKFARFLMSATISSMNMTARNYMFVPVQDFSHQWTDQMLYDKYGLTQEERDYIETTVKPME